MTSSVVDEIKARLDIVEYIGQYVPLKRAGRHLKGLCPFHNEKSGSFMVDPVKQTYHCYGACSDGGDLITFAMKKHGWSFGEALRELAKLAGVEIKQSPSRRAQEQRLDYLHGLVQATVIAYHKALLEWPNAERARDYLSGRGLTEATIKAFQLGFAPPGKWDRMTKHLLELGYKEDDLIAAGVAVHGEKGVYDWMRDRIVIPIFDPRGRAIALAGRGMSDRVLPKYLNGPSTVLFDKAGVLFGYRREACQENVVIVEGYMDVIQAQQAGFKNVVAQMGTALTERHLKLLKNSESITIVMDGDEAGQAAAQRSLEVLVKSEREVRMVELPQDCDPDDIIRDSTERWLEELHGSEPIADYIIRTGCADLPDNASLPERMKVVKRLMPLLMACETDVYKKWNIQMLAARLRLSADDLMDMAHIPAEAAVEIVETKALNMPLLEVELLSSILQDDTAYVKIRRRFREIGIKDFVPEDFSDTACRLIMELFVKGQKQYDHEVIAYIRDQLPSELEDTLDDILNAHGSESLLDAAMILRLRRVQDECDQLIGAEDFETARERLREKAIIQMA